MKVLQRYGSTKEFRLTSKILNTEISQNRGLQATKKRGFTHFPQTLSHLETSSTAAALGEGSLELLVLVNIITNLNTLHAVMPALYEEMEWEVLKGICNREEHETFADRGEE